MRSASRTLLLAAALGLALIVAGCGSEDFENEPRPAAPIELTAKVDDKKVVVSPLEIDGAPVGAGLANVTISNLTGDGVQLTFSGPSDRTTDTIVANGVLDYKLELAEGTYSVSASSGAREAELIVGPPRASSQNELLLP